MIESSVSVPSVGGVIQSTGLPHIKLDFVTDTVLGDSTSESLPTISLDISVAYTVNSFRRFSMYGAEFAISIIGRPTLNRPNSKLCLSGSWYNGSVCIVPVI